MKYHLPRRQLFLFISLPLCLTPALAAGPAPTSSSPHTAAQTASSSHPVATQAAAAALDPAKIVYLLRQTKVVKPDQPLNVVLSQKQAIVLTDRRASETDNDVKIDAVLIAREVITGFPEQISRVRVTFQKPGSTSADQIDVTAVDVKAYGTGAVDAKQLLAALELTPVDFSAMSAAGTANTLKVTEGPLLDKRLLLLSRIEALKAKGTSVKPFMDLFSNIENEAPKASIDQLDTDIAHLADVLAEQENLLKEANMKPTHTTASIYQRGNEAAGSAAAPWTGARMLEIIKKHLEAAQKKGVDVSQSLAKVSEAENLLKSGQREQAHAILDKLMPERFKPDRANRRQWNANNQ